MADNKFIHDNGCKEAVCVDAGRVYDSCSDKDCIEDIPSFKESVIAHWSNDVAPKM